MGCFDKFPRIPHLESIFEIINGKAEPNEQIKVVMHPAGGGENTFYPRLETIIPNTSLTWVGKMADYGCVNLGVMFSGSHYFHLEEQDDNVTYLHHGEEFSGALIWMLSGQLETIYRDGFMAMNSALKERSEEIYSNGNVTNIGSDSENGQRKGMKQSRHMFFSADQSMGDPTKQRTLPRDNNGEDGFKPKL